jgi:hypothetical protein
MKRVALLTTAALLSIALLTLAVGCQSEGTTPSSDSTATSLNGASQTSESLPPSSDPTTLPTSSAVFAPHDLLSADEASELSGHPTTLDPGTLSEDPANGTISERYAYDLDGTGIHALVEIHQDSFKPSAAIQSGDTVLRSFEFEQELSKDDITSVSLGEQAFTFTDTGQLHMYYQGYYVVVAFDADPYDSSKNAPLNVLIGTRILTNLQEALQ